MLIGLLAACSTSSESTFNDVDMQGASDATDAIQDLVESDQVAGEDSQYTPDNFIPDPDLSEVIPADLLAEVLDDVDEEIADVPQVDLEPVDEVMDVPFVGCGDEECGDEEDCASCPEDCGDCPPLLDWCQLSGGVGDQVECSISLAAKSDSSPKATQFQLDMNFVPDLVAFDGTTCPSDGVDLCEIVGVLPTQHAINTAEQGPGVVRLIITKPGEPAAISEAYLEGDEVVGEPYVLDLLFSLTSAIPEEAPVAVSLTDMLGSDATGSPLNAVQESDGLIVTD